MNLLNVKLIENDFGGIVGRLPTRGSEFASGLDLYVPTDDGFMLQSRETRLILLQIAVEIPTGFEGQIRPRSSLNKQGVLCHFGTIDSDYRGNIGVVLTNLSALPVEIDAGMRIAQLVICPVALCEPVEVYSLSDTGRGSGGFGSTGK